MATSWGKPRQLRTHPPGILVNVNFIFKSSVRIFPCNSFCHTIIDLNKVVEFHFERLVSVYRL